MHVLVVEPDERRRNQVVRILKQRRAQVLLADSARMAFRLAVGQPDIGLIIVGTGGRDAVDGIDLCAELRRRNIGEIQPSVILMGPIETPRQLFLAFEVGVNDWMATPEESVIDLHLAIGTRVVDALEGTGDALHLFRRLSSAPSGVFRCAAGVLDARVEVRKGRIAQVSLEANSRPLMRLVENEARRNIPEIKAWANTSPSATLNWRKALTEWGFWERVRLRDALAQHARHVLRVLGSFPRLAVSFEPRPVEWAEDLAFAPEEVLPDAADRGAPLSFARGRLEFLRLPPANDVRMTSVS